MTDRMFEEESERMVKTLIGIAQREIDRCTSTPLEQFNRLVEVAERHAERGNKVAAALCSFAALRVYRNEREAVEVELYEEYKNPEQFSLDLPIRIYVSGFDLGIAL